MKTVSPARRRAEKNTNAAGQVFDVRTVKTGEVIFREGSMGLHMLLVENGMIEISKTAKSGEKVVLGVVQPGGIFGEMALIDQSPRMATALEASTLRVIPNDIFQEKFEKLDALHEGHRADSDPQRPLAVGHRDGAEAIGQTI
ncbi:MAG: cyclic nucleotide-binding domain-containing protein [Alphaproteobacteria bacterium]|nr:cyclic nucleotide-binding domain-containing protein [Alphaproteobacteria bacterium]